MEIICFYGVDSLCEHAIDKDTFTQFVCNKIDPFAFKVLSSVFVTFIRGLCKARL